MATAKIPTPTGLVGAEPRRGVGVAVTVGRRGSTGMAELTDRFWFMTPTPHAQTFGSRSYQTRDPHPGFVAWNTGAEVVRKRTAGGAIGRFATLKGNIIHANLNEALLWNRSAQKLSAPHPNPKSQRPACEGDGVRAVRFEGEVEGVERYGEIPCPNQECVFAMNGLCKPSVHFIFRLRWNPDDPFESQFQALRAKWTSHSWNSLKNLLGMFEAVLGTEAVAPWMPREEWKAGLAAELGVEHPSLIGMPFSMTIGSKTRAADAKTPQGRRYPVVHFSEDGDLVEWLLAQRLKFRALGAVEPLALPEPSVTDPVFLEIERHADRLDLASIPESADSGPDGTAAGGRWGDSVAGEPVDCDLVGRDGEYEGSELSGSVLPSAPAAADVGDAPLLPLGPPWETISARDAEALALRLKALGRDPLDLLEAAGIDPAQASDLPHLPADKLRKVCSLLEAWERAGRGRQ